MTDQLPHPTCPDCGDPLPPDSPQALCPACLMRQALASRTIADGGKPVSPPLTPAEIADKFPGFEILECLGRGGMGVVYKARQKSLDRLVAIKILPPERVGEEKFAERFAREAQTLARLNHPNIVTAFDYGQTGGLFYIVMEFVDGVNLRDLLRDGKLEPKQALAIIPPICDALQFAHDKGIVHRDIKPENLLLDKDGRVKIADFGIAKLMDAAAPESESRAPAGEDQRSAQTGATFQAGTRGYSAPEQSSGSLDHRADIYALGVVLYEMLTGERPDKEVVAPSHKVQIDVRLDEIVLRALEKNPELRYQQVSDVKTMVETIATTPPTAVEASVPPILPVGTSVIPPPETIWQMLKSRLWPPMVVRRNGQRVLNWPAVAMRGIRGLLLLIPIAAIFIVGGISSHESGWLAWFGVAWLVFGLLFISAVIAIRVLRGFSCPLNELPELDNPVDTGSAPQVPSGGKTVAAAFQSAENSAPLRFSRTAIWATLWILVLPAGLLINTFATLYNAEQPRHAVIRYVIGLPGIVLIVLGMLGVFGTTILGWLAAAQIRRSEGMLYGMWLAAFDGLLFPLLIFDAVVVKVLVGFSRIFAEFYSNFSNLDDPQVHPSLTTRLANLFSQHDEIAPLIATLVVIVVDFLIIRAVWRKVSLAKPSESPRSLRQRLVIGVAFLIAVGFLGLLGTGVWSMMEPIQRPAAVRDAVANHSFGPMIKREVVETIDFDSGKVANSLPESVTKSSDIAMNVLNALSWMEREGMDAITEPSGDLKGAGMKAKAVDKDAWESLTADQIVATLEPITRETWQDLDPQRKTDEQRKTPATWVFETREGGKGLLQVLEQSKTGVNVRYKLVQGGDSVAKGTAQPGVSAIAQGVREVAQKLAAAMRAGDDAAMKVNACDLIAGWRDALPVFAKELRGKLQELAGTTEPLEKIDEVFVDGDFAVVKTAKLEKAGACLIVFFANTPDGWQNWTLRNAPMDAKLKDRLAKEVATLDGVFKKRGIAFVDLLATGKFTDATAQFADVMRNAMPEAKLAGLWHQLETTGGKFLGADPAARIERKAEFFCVYVPCRWERNRLDIKVVFDLAGNVSGLWMVPAVKPEAGNRPVAEIEKSAVPAAEAWLALVDGAKYAESWKAASALFQGGVTEAAWINSMETFRKPLGNLISRKMVSAQPVKEMPGAPDGQFVVMQFDSSFAGKKSAVETVTFLLENDGQWKAAGYFIK